MDDFELQLAAFSTQIEQELAERRLSFPTVLELSLRIKQLADDPDASLHDIAAAIRGEPVLSAKTVRMANTVLLNPFQAKINSVNDAVARIGLAAVRCLAYAVAAEQLAKDHRSPRMRLIASGLWLHSLDVASWAYALASHLKIGSADSALLAGIMRNIGQFYLLAKASDFPALERDLDRFAEFVAAWDQPIGRDILEIFEIPESILDAVDESNLYAEAWPPSDLNDLLFIATLAAETPNPFETLLGNTRRPDLLKACLAGVDEAEVESVFKAAREIKDEILAAVCG